MPSPIVMEMGSSSSNHEALRRTARQEAAWAFLDLEMTGLDPASDRIIEICLERVVGAQLQARLCTLIRPADLAPGQPLPPGVHGIEAPALQDAPPFAQVAPELLQLLDGAVLVAHGARHDLAFLEAELARLSMRWQRPLYLDTLPLARRRLTLPRYGLAQLAEHFAVDNPRPHRAANDVTVLRAVWTHLLTGAAAITVDDVLRMCRTQVDVKAVLETARRAQAAGRVARLRYRPSGKPAQELSFCATAVRADLDPPRVLGYLLPSRGRRELRADRILSFEILDP